MASDNSITTALKICRFQSVEVAQCYHFVQSKTTLNEPNDNIYHIHFLFKRSNLVLGQFDPINQMMISPVKITLDSFLCIRITSASNQTCFRLFEKQFFSQLCIFYRLVFHKKHYEKSQEQYYRSSNTFLKVSLIEMFLFLLFNNSR